MTSGNMLPTILTRSGKYFDFTDPDKSAICIEDIAHGLSNICRFGGQCREFYSVAQHCVIASAFVAKGFEYEALMHDAAEAFIGDMPSPLKMLIPEYRAIERRVEAAIATQFFLPNPMPKEVKEIDLIMLATEHRDLAAPHGDEWGCLVGVTPLKQTIMPWSPSAAYEEFMSQYSLLVNRRIMQERHHIVIKQRADPKDFLNQEVRRDIHPDWLGEALPYRKDTERVITGIDHASNPDESGHWQRHLFNADGSVA